MLTFCHAFTVELGDLDKVKRVVKLVGFVNCVDEFAQQPQVVNGASDFFVEVRRGLRVQRERGKAAGVTVGTPASTRSRSQCTLKM